MNRFPRPNRRARRAASAARRLDAALSVLFAPGEDRPAQIQAAIESAPISARRTLRAIARLPRHDHARFRLAASL